MKRKILILATLTILILFSSFAFAQDDSTGEIVTLENNTEDHIIAENANEDIISQNENEIYTASGDEMFTKLNTEISNNNEISLSKNYTYNSRYDFSLKNGIDIVKNTTINGNNFTIDGNGILSIFNIKNNAKLILNNICIKNTFNGDTSIINNQGELIFKNVNFTSSRTISQTGSGYFRDIYNAGTLTITDSNFIDSEFEISTTATTNMHNINVRGFIDNHGQVSISNTIFDNNRFTPTNRFGNNHEISTILFNDANAAVILDNITVTNNDVRYTSSAQPVFRGLIRSENGNLTIKNSLFENNTALFSGNSPRLGIISANGNKLLINNTLFKTNEFNDAAITSSADNITIVKSVFDSNKLDKYIIQNKGSGTLNVNNNLFLKNTAPYKLIDSPTFKTNIDENYWGTNDPDFRDIASTSSTPTYIVLNVTGPTEVNERETIYNITLNKVNTGLKIKDNSIYDYYIDVQSNNLGTSTPVPLNNGIGYYIYVPIDKGEDMLTFGSIKLKVNVTVIFLSANIEIITEYENTAFAGTNNSIIAKVFVNKDFGIYEVKFYADGIEIGNSIQELSRTPKEIIFTDNTIRPIDDTTVAGANNRQINYTVYVYRNEDLIGNKTLIVPLLYNGYLGKEYGYPITDVEFNYTTTINGDIMIQTQDDTTYIGASVTKKEYEWRTVLSSTSQFTEGLLYVPYNWDKTTTGPYPEFNLIFNDVNINNRVIGKYKDQANVGSYGTLGYGVLIYNVTDCIRNGRNTLKLEKEKDLTPVYPPTLISFFNTTGSETLKTVYIKNSADLLYNAYNLANRPIEANTQIILSDLTNITKATLYSFAAGAGVDEADLKFNNALYKNIWENSTGTNYHGAFIADVTNLLQTSNRITFISTGGTILSLQNILILSHPLVKEITQIKLETEYTNTAYAGTNNTLTANVKMNKTGTYSLRLFADGKEVANATQYLTTDWVKIHLTDKTVRPIDETTVAGAQNRNINYTLAIYQNDRCVASSSLIVPLRYNGYLGKDYAYPNNSIEFNYQNTISGDILIQIQEDSTYLELGQTNRIDNWEITLPENSNIINAFLYISYNWDKTSTSDYPNLSLTFNGRNIESKVVGRYKDQSNLGTSGKYGYGLLIYDVSDLIYKGQNSLTIKKESGLTAVYPSTLITLYNTTNSNSLKNIIICNNADLLLNSYNLADRPVESVSTINVDLPENISNSTAYIFASSANNGDADLKINNQTYSNIWEQYSNTQHNGVFKIDLNNSIKSENTIRFISTGGTILALQNIIVIEMQTQSKEADNPENKSTPAEAKVTIKTTPKLTSKKKTYKVKAKKKKMTATLKTNKGKAISGAKITFKIKGKTYKAKTNKKGVATVKINLKKKGKYTVTIKFAGNNLYNAKTIKTKLIIKK